MNVSPKDRFNQIAQQYQTHAIIENTIAERVLENLEFFNIQPKRILDLGCGVGELTNALQKQYSSAEVIGLDAAYSMLAERKNKQEDFLVCSDAESIPFSDQSFDFICANLLLPWCDQEKFFAEVSRVLSPEGLFFFTSFGPPTFQELFSCVAEAKEEKIKSPFLDMHNIGDALLKNNFEHPVMETEDLTIHYREFNTLLEDLHYTANECFFSISKETLPALESVYAQFQTAEKKYPVTYEIIYGHAWKVDPSKQSVTSDEVTFPVEKLNLKR